MTKTHAIRLSDGPADGLVRIHAESSDWDEPDVRYVRRKSRRSKPNTIRLYAPEEEEDLVLVFGGVRVLIRAAEDHVEIVLQELTFRPRAA